jgi:hypothetical protein
MLAAEGTIYGMMYEVPHCASVYFEAARFLPVQGSPFSWQLVEHANRKQIRVNADAKTSHIDSR